MDVLEQVTQMADRLSPPEQLQLVEHLAKRLRIRTLEAKKPQSLRGTWKDKFPEDTDIEADIREIRDEWKKEFDEL
ncbi:MAG: hypothetical protein H0W45_02085 [Acidobacteria bacterium]|nr:hypothetical protein [Acidobacteriota bacterium]